MVRMGGRSRDFSPLFTPLLDTFSFLSVCVSVCVFAKIVEKRTNSQKLRNKSKIKQPTPEETRKACGGGGDTKN